MGKTHLSRKSLGAALYIHPSWQEKVEEIKRLIEAGEYETSERIEGAARQLLEEL